MLKHPWFDRLKKDRLLLTILIAAAAYRLGVGLHIVDDAFITFRYADNLVAGRGFVYNPGEYVMGTSSPLFAFLLALFGLVKISAPIAAFSICLLATLLTLLVIFKIMAHAGLREGGYFTCALYAVAPFSVTYGVSGMETALYLLLVFTLLAFPSAPSWRVAVLGTLAMLCRPDGVLAVAVILVTRFLGDRKTLKKDLFYFLLLGLPWLAFLQLYYGQIIPQSLLAKAHLKRDTWTSLINFFDFFRLGWPGLQTLLLLPGVMAFRKKPISLPLRLWMVWGGIYAVVFLAANAFTDFPWYFSPLFLVQTIVAGCGLAFVVHKFTPKKQTVLCLCLLAAGCANGVRHKRNLTFQAKGRETLYKAVAEVLWTRSQENATLAATEVGAVGYYFKGNILDLVGLISPEAVKLGPLEALKQSKAEWLVSYDTHFDFKEDSWFAGHYLLEGKVPVAEGRNLYVFRRNPRGN